MEQEFVEQDNLSDPADLSGGESEEFFGEFSGEFNASSARGDETFVTHPDQLNDDEIALFGLINKTANRGILLNYNRRGRKKCFYASRKMPLLILGRQMFFDGYDVDLSRLTRFFSAEDLAYYMDLEDSSDVVVMQATREMLASESSLSAEDKKRVLGHFNEHAQDFAKIFNIWQKLRTEDVLGQWAKGEFIYPESLFESEQDIDLWILNFQQAFLRMSLEDAQEQASIVRAFDSLSARLKAYEALEVKGPRRGMDPEEKARVKAKREAEQAARQERVDAAQADDNRVRREAFLAVPQPYILRGDMQAAYDQLVAFGATTSRQAPAAQFLAQILWQKSQALDVRDAGILDMRDMAFSPIHMMGDLLFSPSNIVNAAKAFGVGDQIDQTITIRQTREMRAAALHVLYTASPAVRDAVDSFLAPEAGDDGGVFLLASLTLEAGRSQTYADFLMKAHRQLSCSDEQQALTDFEEAIAEFLAADQEACRRDEEYLALRAAYEEKRESLKIDQTRNNLAHEVRQTFQGVRVKHIAQSAIPDLADKKKGFDCPAAWAEDLEGRAYAAPSPEGDKYIRVHSDDVPFKFFDIKRNATISRLQTALEALREECSLYLENVKMVQAMTSGLGFQMVGGADGLKLAHHDYEIAVSLTSSELEKTIAFERAKEEFEARLFQQGSLLQTAQAAGVDVAVSDMDGSVTFRHAGFDDAVFAPRGYFSHADFAQAQSYMERLQAHQDMPDIAPLGESLDGGVSQSIVHWAPEGKAHMIIFDAGPFYNLAAPRGRHGRTWLDFIKCTARDRENCILIPSVVADWEVQGRIPVFDEAGDLQGFEQIDQRFKQSGYPHEAIATPFGHFLQSASRARITAEGMTLYQNENPRLIIVDTQEDDVLWQRIRAAQTKENPIRVMAEEIHGQGEGEKAINRLIATLPFSAFVTIVSDDKRYFEKEALDVMPLGQEICHLSTASYLDMEIQAHELEFRTMLKEERPLSLYRMGKDVAAFWKDIDPRRNQFFGPYVHRKALFRPFLKPAPVSSPGASSSFSGLTFDGGMA